MKPSRISLTIYILGVMILSACGRQTAQPGDPTGPLMPVPGTSGDLRNVTLEDQGKTIPLVFGESFLLSLGGGDDWVVTISDESVIGRVMNIAEVVGAQGVYEAHRAGTVTLEAVGDPACRQSKPPCMAPSILFSVTIVVK